VQLPAAAGAGVGRQVANAQVIFNLIGVAAVILFLPVIAQSLERLIPDTYGDRKLHPEAVQAAE